MFEAPITSISTLPLDLKERWLFQKQQAELFALALRNIGLDQYGILQRKAKFTVAVALKTLYALTFSRRFPPMQKLQER